MVQIYGSGTYNYANTAQVDDTGHLYTISTISGIPQITISGGINIGSVHASVDTVYVQSGANIIGSMGITHIDAPETIGSHAGIIPVSGIFHDVLGSVYISNPADVGGSEAVITAGSIQTYDPIGIGSVHLVPGSLEVFQTTASDMQISGVVTVSGIFHDVLGSVSVQQDSIPWITSGTSTVAGSIYTTGSIRVANLYEGSEVWQGTDPWITSGTATVSGLFHDVIGSVYVSQIVPGTAATNLGKAEDTTHTTGDVGVMALTVRKDEPISLASADGEYVPLLTDSAGRLHSNVEHDTVLDGMNVTTGWSVLGNDTTNLATTTNHVLGTAALEFDKANGLDDTIFAGIQKTISSIDISDHTAHGVIQLPFYVSSTAQIQYIFVRIGTDSSHYNEWRIDLEDITGGIWSPGIVNVNSPDVNGNTGNGWDPTAITYIAAGVAFDNQINTLADIRFDELAVHSSLHTLAAISSEVSSSVSTPNVRLQAYGNAVDTNAGNVSSQTLRTVLATDQARLAGSIVNMPIVGISGTVIGVSGVVNQGTDPWVISGTASVNVLTDPVPISGIVNQGTDPWVISGLVNLGSGWQGTGSVHVTNPSTAEITGSVEVYSSTGSVEIYGTLATTPGSNVWVKGGSIFLYSGATNYVDVPNRVAGSIVNMPIVGISGTVVGVSGIVNLGTQWTGVGSVVISGTVPVTGEFVVGSESVITAGSVEVYQGTITDLNATVSGTVSANILTDPVPISGIVNQGTAPWETSGTATISAGANSVFGVSGTVIGVSGIVNIGTDPVPVLGSVTILSSTGSLEVYQTTNADMQVQATQETSPWEVSGTATISAGANSVFGISGTVVGISGVVNQGTDPWVISGVVNVGSIVGSIAITNFAALGSQRTISAGSVIITNEITISEVGSPCYKRATLVASGTYADVWPIGGVGSRFEMHGFHISTDNPGYIRIANSGTALATTQAGVITDYHLNYASGATIEKTFSTPIIPNGAGSPVGFGATVVGSTLVTFYGREVK